jgi:hypothetical protein
MFSTQVRDEKLPMRVDFRLLLQNMLILAAQNRQIMARKIS